MPRALPGFPAFAAVALGLAAACAARSPVHPRAAEELARGYRHLDAGDLERAEIAFAHALEFDPDLPEALNGVGVVARSRAHPEEALRAFERAVRIDPDFAEGHANLGEALLALGRQREAEGELRAALAIDPDLVAARQNLARALLLRGLAEPDRREALWAEARRAYLHLLESGGPEPAAAHHDLGFMEYVSGRFDAAERSYARAAELAPRSPEALHGLCIARARLGRCAEAAEACERCLAVDPGAARCAQSLPAARACTGR